MMSLYSKKLHTGITTSKSSMLPLNMLLIFDMHDLNGSLFLKDIFLFLLLARLVHVTLILSFTAIYATIYAIVVWR